MGLVHLRRIDDYWSDSSSLKTVYARSLMKRDRFKAILAFLHLNDNDALIAAGEEGHDTLHKIRPVYDHLRCVFKSLYVPEQDISIREIICPWKGRGEMNACRMDAPSECGMQIHEMCENSSGYIYDFEVQAGERGESTSSAAVCYRLLTPLKNKGYTVFMGSYYCCPALAEKLASEDIMVVGICCKDRLGMPEDLQQSVLQTGEQMYRRKGQMLALKWHQDNDVYMLTTMHRPVMVHVKSGTQDGIQPAALVSFTKNMAGVDRNSEVFGFMPAYCHTLKWWKKLFFYLLALTVMQAHTLHSKYLKTKSQKPWLVDRFWKHLLEEMEVAYK
ncbi:piggyBac transposable element-derived protein 4-like isoform X1 [Pomacea canaliculata]|uniref:piggyBac transposable element-derived protein 4-like isoform X1 n=1 Tax=Pomacea canaliculata TaxID=400727 RepID=UPI000D730455|nr:piggyBac transposable element-derived protein 4-like isoform X1 [Pomacea canaliculata]XP_025109311.1 piggyBac transposable element-derived protein 4-like isoform X1 [Pomacea canaliculata]